MQKTGLLIKNGLGNRRLNLLNGCCWLAQFRSLCLGHSCGLQKLLAQGDVQGQPTLVGDQNLHASLPPGASGTCVLRSVEQEINMEHTIWRFQAFDSARIVSAGTPRLALMQMLPIVAATVKYNSPLEMASCQTTGVCVLACEEEYKCL